MQTNTYNALGQRVKKAGAQTLYFMYDEAGHLLGEYQQNGAVVREYIWLGDRLVRLISAQKPGVVLQVHTDHLGSPRAVSEGATVLWRWEGDAFGNTAANEDVDVDTNPLIMPLRFPGQYKDPESGLHYNYFRDYNPATGRYVQSDPIGLLWDYGSPQLQLAIKLGLFEPVVDNDKINRLYGYVEQNPVMWIDPSGLACFDSACVARAKALNSSSQLIAPGNKIRKVKELCEKWGGKPKEWKKKKGWDIDGTEYHWYELRGQKFGMKLAGQADPF